MLGVRSCASHVARRESRIQGGPATRDRATSGQGDYGRTSTSIWAWLTSLPLEVKVQSRVLPSELPRPRSQERPPPKRLKQRIACLAFQLWIYFSPKRNGEAGRPSAFARLTPTGLLAHA